MHRPVGSVRTSERLPMSTAPDFPPLPARAARQLAAQTIDLVKVYGSGKTQVTALDHVNVTFDQGSLPPQ